MFTVLSLNTIKIILKLSLTVQLENCVKFEDEIMFKDIYHIQVA